MGYLQNNRTFNKRNKNGSNFSQKMIDKITGTLTSFLWGKEESIEDTKRRIKGALEKKQYKAFSNFSPPHGREFLRPVFEFEIEQLRKDKNRQTLIVTNKLRGDIFDHENIESLEKILELGGDLKIISKSEIQNTNILDDSPLKEKLMTIDSLPFPRMVITQETYAVELNNGEEFEEEHEAIFFVNINEIEKKIKFSDSKYPKELEIIIKDKNYYQEEFTKKWEKS